MCVAGSKGSLLFKEDDKGGMRGSQGYLLPANSTGGDTLQRCLAVTPGNLGLQESMLFPTRFLMGVAEFTGRALSLSPARLTHIPCCGRTLAAKLRLVLW